MDDFDYEYNDYGDHKPHPKPPKLRPPKRQRPKPPKRKHKHKTKPKRKPKPPPDDDYKDFFEDSLARRLQEQSLLSRTKFYNILSRRFEQYVEFEVTVTFRVNGQRICRRKIFVVQKIPSLLQISHSNSQWAIGTNSPYDSVWSSEMASLSVIFLHALSALTALSNVRMYINRQQISLCFCSLRAEYCKLNEQFVTLILTFDFCCLTILGKRI